MSEPPDQPSCPQSQEALLDRSFLEHRAKLLDLAAFLDRCDRSASDGDEDFRLAAMRGAMKLLLDRQPERAKRVLEQLSDHSTELLAQAPQKGATGAPPPK
ncbi:MAG: hypothetical protein AAGJ38_08270 [Planctomycetota bacterium]